VRFLNKKGKQISEISSGEPLTIEVEFDFKETIDDPHIGIALFRDDQAYVFGPNSRFDNITFEKVTPGKARCELIYDSLDVSAGEYRVSVAIWERLHRKHYSYDCGYYALKVNGRPSEIAGICAVRPKWIFDKSILKKRHNVSTDRVQELAQQIKNYESLPKVQPIAGNRVSMDLFSSSASLHEKHLIHWGREVELLLELELAHDVSDAYVWIGVVRDPDRLLCAGWASWEDRAISLKKGLSKFKLKIAQWPLTTGRYHVVFALWDESLKPILFEPNIMPIYVAAGREDHGVTYLPHQWKIQLPCTEKI